MRDVQSINKRIRLILSIDIKCQNEFCYVRIDCNILRPSGEIALQADWVDQGGHVTTEAVIWETAGVKFYVVVVTRDDAGTETTTTGSRQREEYYISKTVT